MMPLKCLQSRLAASLSLHLCYCIQDSIYWEAFGGREKEMCAVCCEVLIYSCLFCVRLEWKLCCEGESEVFERCCEVVKACVMREEENLQ